jgi:hypothetical protein
MDIKSSDLSARLLATENLSVQRARTRTASFDVKSRVLTLPLWKDMTPEIEDMLVGHEVGHALYTTDDYFVPLQENPKMMSYLNVLEDVRIEKLIKRKYPGLRKRMNEGYKQLNDRDFFGVKQVQSFDDLLLIDKINLYFKAGFSCGVEFTPEEKQFANRAERTETVNEVIALAEEIWAYSKQQLEEKKKRVQQESTPEDMEDLEEEQDPQGEFDDDFDYDDMEEIDDDQDRELKPQQQKSSGEQKEEEREEQQSVGDQELESKTEKAFAEKLEDLADESTEYIYHEFDTDYWKSPVVGYKQILNETKVYWTTDGQDPTDDARVIASTNSAYDKFKAETTSAVNYLVKEFEMRKSAALYKRAAVSKSGSLDMKRVWSYKLNDDLFKRVTVLPQGKNHGMLFLLDWSGSMDLVLEDTLKQVVNLAMFCARINIPYRVLAFTSQYSNIGYESESDYAKHRDWVMNKRTRDSGKNIMTNTGSFNLLELFSNKMTTSEFHSMAKRLVVNTRKFQWNKGYDTGGTPLNEALVWMYLNIDKYIKENSIEKLTLITLTDGDGGSLYSSNGDLSEQRYAYGVDGITKKIKQKHFIRDNVTQKTYQLSRFAGQQTETYLRMIKDRHDIMVVGFYICRNARRDLHSALNSNLPNYAGDVYSQIESWRKDFRQQGFASIKNTGRDDLFLIPQTSTKIVEGDLDVKADANAKVIARDFGKFLNVKKTSRVLLNRFVGYVA